MQENNRDQQGAGGSTQQEQRNDQEHPMQNISQQEEQDQNPQRGSQWNNYQTRELSDQGSGGKNRSRESSQ